MTYDLKSLEQFLQKPLPEVSEEVWTFLDIAGFPNYENVLSNIYAHYLDKNASHSLGDLFLKALSNAVRKKVNPDFEDQIKYLDDWNEWLVLREESVDGKRIDILLQETSEEDSKYIIIENKIYADLYNPLEVYWSYTRSKNKIGIVLSLTAEDPDHNGFINVTHLEFMIEVKALVGDYLENSNDRDLVIIKDLLLNLKQQLNQPTMDKELIEFYHKNRDKIESIYLLKGEVRADFLKAVENIGNKLGMDIKARGARWYRTLIENENRDLEISFCFYNGDESTNSNYMTIELEASGKAANKLKNEPKLGSLLKKYSKYNIISDEVQSRPKYLYIGYKGYSFEEIDYSPENLLSCYERDWKPFISEIKSML